jgi:hypothetical protein
MKKDVYETAFKAVRIAADAYRRGEPGNRQVLGFAARKALDCRIAEAERRDFGAIIELIILSRRILEVTETVILDERDPEERDKLHQFLGELMRTFWWVPVLMGPRGKSAGELIVDSLQIGQALPINRNGKWSLKTPMNRLCINVLSTTESILDVASSNVVASGPRSLSKIYPGLTAKQSKELIKIAKERKRLKPLSKKNAAKWAKSVLIPTILTLDPRLETIPGARQILNSKKVKKNGAKPGFLRSELTKYLSKALKTILV